MKRVIGSRIELEAFGRKLAANTLATPLALRTS